MHAPESANSAVPLLPPEVEVHLFISSLKIPFHCSRQLNTKAVWQITFHVARVVVADGRRTCKINYYFLRSTASGIPFRLLNEIAHCGFGSCLSGIFVIISSVVIRLYFALVVAGLGPTVNKLSSCWTVVLHRVQHSCCRNTLLRFVVSWNTVLKGWQNREFIYTTKAESEKHRAGHNQHDQRVILFHNWFFAGVYNNMVTLTFHSYIEICQVILKFCSYFAAQLKFKKMFSNSSRSLLSLLLCVFN